MRVRIGPYVNHHIGRRFERWYIEKRHKKDEWDVLLEEGDFLDRVVDFVISKCIYPFCNLTINRFYDWRGRKLKVKIHNYDTWSMDSTLAYIIHPMLLQLKNRKHGSPFVDNEDVPEDLRSKVEPSAENGYLDETHHERWQWVLDELIWTFGIYNTEWELEFYSEPKGEWSLENRGTFDNEGREAVQKRIDNGLRLFGKYYQNLWD